ncbi:MAG: NADH-quinone oxidoreductase subunit L [SAR202 cluster bacterium]|nr:NADH-quinone oxidoreductase subunit L [SAR202 cluster bacterium]|tara:strand:- start:815 stop:2740 length:1926 start_codon:yes stop_codon:yes gene_type:complete
MSEHMIWLIPGLPLIAFLVNGLVIRPFVKSDIPRISGYIGIAAIMGSLILSILAGLDVFDAPDHRIEFVGYSLINITNFSLTLNMGILLDPLTALMLIVVSSVSLMVLIYSQGYMSGDANYTRYFAFISLFASSMLGLVIANNLLILFVFWELVGISSYLLIGFWYNRPAAAAAAKKAFIVTRIGDLGFLIAILFIFNQIGTLDIAAIHENVNTHVLSGAALTWAALGIFAGAAGKSAQFPLHVWLPDAMEGPTPVSALIHAATMVAAGVFLVARFFFMFEESADALRVVAIIGAITAVAAALLGVVMFDIKRVLAYSTISQLGYMMMALGVGAYGAAIFHLFNHAFFKALLFLGSGSVNHATGTFDMRQMGGLRRYMPWTTATFIIGTLSLSGIPPFAGFWSKDEILSDAFHVGTSIGDIVFWCGLIGAGLTAFYMMRATLLTFFGDYKGGAKDEHGSHEHPHESPWVMVFPMILLAIPSTLSWLVNTPWSHDLSHFLGAHSIKFNPTVAALSIGVASLGFIAAYGGYRASWYSPERISKSIGPIYTFISRKYYMDELYESIFVKNVLYRGIVTGLAYLDTRFVDRIINNIGWFGRNIGEAFKLAQTGHTQAAAAVLSLGLLTIYLAFFAYRDFIMGGNS